MQASEKGSRIERAWRLVWTGLAFASFGIGGLILTLTAFPLINLLVRDRERRADLAQGLVHYTFRLHVRYMTLFGVVSTEMIGVEKLAGDRGVLFVSNHPSLLDVVFLISEMRRAQCIVKGEIFDNPFMRGPVVAANYIRNDGDAEKLIEDYYFSGRVAHSAGGTAETSARGRQYSRQVRRADPSYNHRVRASFADEGAEMVSNTARPVTFYDYRSWPH